MSQGDSGWQPPANQLERSDGTEAATLAMPLGPQVGFYPPTLQVGKWGKTTVLDQGCLTTHLLISNRPPAAKQPSDGPYITQFGHAESRGRIGLAPKHRECGAIRVQTGGVGISKEHVNPPTAPRRHMHGHMHGHMRVPAGPLLRLVFGGSSLRLGAHIWLSPAGSRPLAWYCGHQQQPAHEAPELCGRVGEWQDFS